MGSHSIAETIYSSKHMLSLACPSIEPIFHDGFKTIQFFGLPIIS